MEFDHVGGHCTMEDCRLHDYLPVQCDACGRTFCGEHFGYGAHGCAAGEAKRLQQSNVVMECSECGRPVVARRGQNPDAELARHIAKECGRTRRSRVCGVEKCKTREVVPIQCKSCLQYYCFEHRIELDHQCSNRKARITHPITTGNRRTAASAASAAKSKTPTAVAAAATAAKTMTKKKFVSSNKNVTPTRAKPLGDPNVPPELRIRLRIASPLFECSSPIDMYFNKRFTVGRMMDEAARLANLRELEDVRLYAFRLEGSNPAKALSRIDPLTICVKPGDCLALDVTEQLELDNVQALVASVETESLMSKFVRVLS